MYSAIDAMQIRMGLTSVLATLSDTFFELSQVLDR